MATILLIGPEDPLLEGLAQSIAGAGHTPLVAHEIDDAAEAAAADTPLVIVAERTLAASQVGLVRLPLESGGAFILYHPIGDPQLASLPLPPVLQRMALADLELPLERHRLLTLIMRVDERARMRGHGGRSEPPEQRI